MEGGAGPAEDTCGLRQAWGKDSIQSACRPQRSQSGRGRVEDRVKRRLKDQLGGGWWEGPGLESGVGKRAQGKGFRHRLPQTLLGRLTRSLLWLNPRKPVP